MTDFASKYGFALADSDSDDDASNVFAFQGQTSQAEAGMQSQTASALFGGDSAEDSTLNYFSAAPPIQTFTPPPAPVQQDKAAQKQITQAPPISVRVEPKVAPAEMKPVVAPSGRINTLL